jgi:transcriptional regulator with GAF, ATPase, and Fis domain
MVTRRQTSASPVAEIARALLAQPEAVPRARVIADKVAALLPGAAAVVYVILDQDNPAWTAKATAGEVTVGKVIDFNAGTLGAVAQSRTLRVFEGASLRREDFSHLDIRRTGVALAYAPLLVDETLVGAIELVCYEQSVSDTALQSLNEIAELAAPAIATALSYEDERNVSLQSISRVAQMYDLEKVFNSTLQMDELLEMIAKKFAEVLKVQGINLWMVSGEAVELVSQAGLDPTVSPGTMQKQFRLRRGRRVLPAGGPPDGARIAGGCGGSGKPPGWPAVRRRRSVPAGQYLRDGQQCPAQCLVAGSRAQGGDSPYAGQREPGDRVYPKPGACSGRYR